MGENIIDGGLIDVSGLDLKDLPRIEEPARTTALDGILVSSGNDGSYGFNATI